MLIVLLAWMFMFFVFISFGDMLLASYNKLCKQSEKYSILNTFLLGIPVLLIVLPLLHFVLPINSYVLLVLCLASLGYWSFNKSRLRIIINQVISSLSIFKKVELLICILLILSFSFVASWGILNYDAGCYHYQFLRWIEDYSTIVGLGNIEERLGFNSNYFILSAPFTMRFLLNEPLLSLQGLFTSLMFVWMLFEVVKSKYSFKTVFLFLLHLVFVAINVMHFLDSSTDVVPNQLVFYLIAYLVLHPNSLKNKQLLFATLPIVILTFKLSLAVFALLSLVVFIQLIKGKSFRSLIFIVVMSAFVVGLWLIRNVILSGYLIFPMYELDFFSFDWKVPMKVALSERSFIKSGAIWQFKNLYNTMMTLFSTPEWRHIHAYVIGVLFSIIVFSIPCFLFLFLRKKIDKQLVIVYAVSIICLFASYISAPDFRFSYGFVAGLVFISICLFADNIHLEVSGKYKKRVAYFLMFLLILHFNVTFWKLSNPNYVDCEEVAEAIFKPRTFDQKNVTGSNLNFREEVINNGIAIYVSEDYSGFTMYKVPSVPDDANNRLGWRFQHYKNLEARGNSIKCGFRTKE